jgi:hypothetical protein
LYFDRFDICLAYWAYATHWHGGQFSDTYAIFGRLERMGFRPGCRSDRPADLGDNAREIYRQLVVKFCGLHRTGPNRKLPATS